MTSEKSPKRASQGEFAALVERLARVVEWLSKGTRALPAAVGRGLRRHALGAVTVVAIVGSGLLVLSKFLDVVRFVDMAGQLLPGADTTRQGSWAILLIGVVAGLAALLGRWVDHPLPALACAALGAAALAMVLIGDLPDVTSSGITGAKLIGEADPGAGFWIELAGAVLTTAAGLVMARLLAVRRSAARYQR
jgi:hypothetical protein